MRLDQQEAPPEIHVWPAGNEKRPAGIPARPPSGHIGRTQKRASPQSNRTTPASLLSLLGVRLTQTNGLYPHPLFNIVSSSGRARLPTSRFVADGAGATSIAARQEPRPPSFRKIPTVIRRRSVS